MIAFQARDDTIFRWTPERRYLLYVLAKDPEADEAVLTGRVSPEQVTHQLRRMRKAAGVETNAELVAFARRQRLIPEAT
jgi:hypothetical protein